MSKRDVSRRDVSRRDVSRGDVSRRDDSRRDVSKFTVVFCPHFLVVLAKVHQAGLEMCDHRFLADQLVGTLRGGELLGFGQDFTRRGRNRLTATQQSESDMVREANYSSNTRTAHRLVDDDEEPASARRFGGTTSASI